MRTMKNTKNTENTEIKKKELGRALEEIRTRKQLSMYIVAKKGNIHHAVAKTVEEGSTNYTIQALLGYAEGVGARIEIVDDGDETREP
jgi:transcriptional regulator with XRE-family HTH domain